MKLKSLLLAAGCAFLLASCSSSPQNKAESSIKDYLKENLKKPGDYESMSFTKLDTLKKADTTDDKKVIEYAMKHTYSIKNSNNDKVVMTVAFGLDKDLHVVKTNLKGLNGDPGTLKGNIYWKYNNYIGNKPDDGAKFTLYSRDSGRAGLKYEGTADGMGNYEIDKVLPGRYLLVIWSKNTTDCPEAHISNMKIYADDIKEVFGFDLMKYQAQLDEIEKLQNEYEAIVMDNDADKYGGLSNQIEKYTEAENKMRAKAEELLKSLPDDVKQKLHLYTPYANSIDFTGLTIEEGDTKTNNCDFGTTCI